ncbi:MAG TPA: thioredoxin family protein [Kofleriaceae bacterium]|nr:thioredoxin family protein [Kofleriaceae bacterium]
MIRALLMLGAVVSSGACERAASDPAPTPTSAPERAAPAAATVPRALAWETDERAAFTRAAAEGKGVMIDFRSEWCAPCKEYEAVTFVDRAVIAHVAPRYVALQIDLTADGPAEQAIMERYRVDTLPTVMFAAANAVELGRVTEFLPPKPFLATATSIADRSAARAAPPPAR